MATRISQEQLNKFINPEAAMAPYERAEKQRAQQSQQDAALAQLIRGKEMDAQAKNDMLTRQLGEAERLRGKYGQNVPVNVEGVSVGAYDPIERLIKQKQLEKPTLTPGQEAADKAFGKEYSDYVAGGGSEQAKKNIGLLEDVETQLKTQGDKAPNIFQKAVQFLPESFSTALTPEIKAQEDQVRTAIQSTLRQVMGSQFTEKEGEGMMQRNYDRRLSAAQNLKKMEPEIRALKAQVQRKMQSAQQFERTGSITGIGAAGGSPVSPQPVRKQYSPSRNQTKIIYSDGSEEIVDGRQ